jgi:two-component system, sensor histidine kinase and response regulator
VLMDCQMPDLDGLGATRAIRRQEQRAGAKVRIPIIALTADSEPSDRERCIKAGMDDLMSKPFSEAQLRQLLAAWQQRVRLSEQPVDIVETPSADAKGTAG